MKHSLQSQIVADGTGRTECYRKPWYSISPCTYSASMYFINWLYQVCLIQWNLSILDTSGPQRIVLIGVLISRVEDVLWQSIGNHLVPVSCVYIREVSAIQGSGLEGCLQFRGLD